MKFYSLKSDMKFYRSSLVFLDFLNLLFNERLVLLNEFEQLLTLLQSIFMILL